MKPNNCIVFLTPGFAENESDTGGIASLQDFFNTWRRTFPNKKIFILSFQFPLQKGWQLWNGINIYSASGKNKKGLFKLICWFQILTQLFKINNKHGIKCIFCFWLGETAFIGQLFSILKKKTLFCYLFGQDVKSSNRYLKLISLKRFTLIGNSVFTANVFKETTGIKPQHIIPLGIDDSIMPKEILQVKYDVIGAGSLNAVKNYSLFIDVIAEVVKTKPILKVLLIGNGTEDMRLRKKIARLNLQHNISLTGKLNRQETLKIMSESAVLLHTSSFESFSMTRLEAFSLGCAVLTFNNGYTLSDKNFIICNSKQEMIEWLQSNSVKETERSKRTVRVMDECVIQVNKLLR